MLTVVWHGLCSGWTRARNVQLVQRLQPSLLVVLDASQQCYSSGHWGFCSSHLNTWQRVELFRIVAKGKFLQAGVFFLLTHLFVFLRGRWYFLTSKKNAVKYFRHCVVGRKDNLSSKSKLLLLCTNWERKDWINYQKIKSALPAEILFCLREHEQGQTFGLHICAQDLVTGEWRGQCWFTLGPQLRFHFIKKCF